MIEILIFFFIGIQFEMQLNKYHVYSDVDEHIHLVIWAFSYASQLKIWCLILFKQFKPQEITDIMKDFDEPGHLAPTGLFLAGLKYMVIQGEPGAVIRGKKVIKHKHSHCFPHRD